MQLTDPLRFAHLHSEGVTCSVKCSRHAKPTGGAYLGGANTMKVLLRVFVATVAYSCVLGCSEDGEKKISDKQLVRGYFQLDEGMTSNEVLASLGEPTVSGNDKAKPALGGHFELPTKFEYVGRSWNSDYPIGSHIFSYFHSESGEDQAATNSPPSFSTTPKQRDGELYWLYTHGPIGESGEGIIVLIFDADELIFAFDMSRGEHLTQP
jgi:hypothetical protein